VSEPAADPSSAPAPPVSDSEPGGFLSPRPGGHPVSHCVRCGKETPPGVALCEADNPGRLKPPSANQLHATILGGVVLGFIGFFLLMRVAVAQGGPYVATVSGRATTAEGGISVAVTVLNTGKAEGVATCRITRDGSPRPDDVTFRTERLAPGASTTLTRDVPPPTAKQPAFLIDRVSAICS
jgi:hypothetical protein